MTGGSNEHKWRSQWLRKFVICAAHAKVRLGFPWWCTFTPFLCEYQCDLWRQPCNFAFLKTSSTCCYFHIVILLRFILFCRIKHGPKHINNSFSVYDLSMAIIALLLNKGFEIRKSVNQQLKSSIILAGSVYYFKLDI